MTWRVDFAAGVIRIEQTKNDEPRTMPYHALPGLASLLHAQREDTEGIQREHGCIVASVFHHAEGRPMAEGLAKVADHLARATKARDRRR